VLWTGPRGRGRRKGSREAAARSERKIKRIGGRRAALQLGLRGFGTWVVMDTKARTRCRDRTAEGWMSGQAIDGLGLPGREFVVRQLQGPRVTMLHSACRVRGSSVWLRPWQQQQQSPQADPQLAGGSICDPWREFSGSRLTQEVQLSRDSQQLSIQQKKKGICDAISMPSLCWRRDTRHVFC
jgi:hypothetical protein